MKKQFRLQHNREFQSIIKKRKQFVTGSVILYYEKNDKHLRVGLSVSKKFGNAVVRNRMRRKARAIIREMDILDLKYDVVLIVRKNFINASFDKQRKAITQVFERLKNEK
ncbi:ribonuclease P protein component [Mycoplasma todarodis]|uniref:Ribonuclease P protein component n=1 Tax=Mycoplasma todarodis TaxID=1937191 RepID=A0A4R0XX71_9MOLU|nr:ribonuclease P protein component [Mycoplasma todarodis]TCG11611.1 ribonuclease P protein component [Mycoplasma todarodis]